MAYIDSPVNKTNEVIEIGKFDKKQTFHFCTLQFKGIEDFYEQGRIVECYLQKKNFLLLPRNMIKFSVQDNDGTREESWYTSLLLIWDERINAYNPEGSIINELEKMLSVEDKINIQGKLIFNNGESNWHFSKASNYTDGDSQYSYLIMHKFVNGEYVYKISSTSSFKEHFKWEGRYLKGVTLDLVFTGRCSNMYNNCYQFGGYKIKDYLVDNNKIILSDVKGVIDLAECNNPVNYVTMLNLLPGWKNPAMMNSDYFSNMSIRIATLVPEDQVTIKGKDIYYKDRVITNMMVVVTRDLELRKNIFREYFRNGVTAASREYIASKETVENIIERFDEARVKQEKQNIINQRQELISYIAQSKRQLNELEERVVMLEYRTREFIPFPEIKLPEKISQYMEPASSMLKMIDGRYVIEQREGIE